MFAHAVTDGLRQFGWQKAVLDDLLTNVTFAQQVLALWRGQATVTVLPKIFDGCAPAWIPVPHWEVVAHQGTGTRICNPHQYRLVPITTRRRGVCGTRVRAKRLAEHPENGNFVDFFLQYYAHWTLPAEWQQYDRISLWGTVFQTDGDEVVRCICRCGSGWSEGHQWVDCHFSPKDAALTICSE